MRFSTFRRVFCNSLNQYLLVYVEALGLTYKNVVKLFSLEVGLGCAIKNNFSKLIVERDYNMVIAMIKRILNGTHIKTI